MFDPKSAQVFKTVTLAKIFPLGLLRFFEIIFFFSFLIFLFFYFLESPLSMTHERTIGIFLLSFFLWGALFLYRCFFNQKLRNPEIKFSLIEATAYPEDFNLAEILDFDAAKAVNLAKKLSKKREVEEMSSLVLLEALFFCPQLGFIFERFCLEIKNFREKIFKEVSGKKERLKKLSFSSDFLEVIREAAQISFSHNLKRITLNAILAALARVNISFKKALAEIGIDEGDIDNVCFWQEQILRKQKRERQFWSRENLMKSRGIAKDWAAGYTIFLDQFSSDLTESQRTSPLFSSFLHQKEIKKLEDALSKSEENCGLLIGEPGTGRETIVKNFAQRINLGRSLPNLNYKRILELDMPSLIAAGRGPGELEGNLKTVFNEALSAGNIILLIRQIHNFIGYEFGAEAVAKIDISGILSQYLTIPNFCLIGITTYEGLHRSIEKSPEVLSRFQRIEIKPTTKEETLLLLEEEVLEREKETGLFFSYKSLREIVDLCDRYIQITSFPKKALDLLEEVIIYTIRYSKKKIVLPETVATIVSEKTEIPVGKVKEEEKEILLNLEEIMHQRVVNQEEGIYEIANALRRTRADIRRGERPIGTFLFLGPTGVGKTETAKTLAASYFGAKKRMIRLDMSEYQEIDSIGRLIGTVKEPGYFTTKVREDPFSLVLLDEIEKAHPDILNLFLQVLDEGHLMDGMGRSVDFTNTIIIGTSNAGSELIRQAIKREEDLQKFKEDFLDEILARGIFRPEFLNRFDAVVLFRPLSEEHLVKIANLMLLELKENLKEKNIEFQIAEGLSRKIAELGFDPVFGAREMRRVIQKKVENNIAKEILSGRVKAGDKIEIDHQTFEVLIK